MFNGIFDKDRNQLVDKFEVLCVLVMLSTLTSNAKISFIFEMFNFNEKGYLTEAETSLMIRTLVTGVYKADPSFGLPTNNIFEIYIADALSFAKEKGVLLRSELIRFSRQVREAQEFMESWRGIASSVLIADGFCWRDPYFSAMNASIAPSMHWLKFGLPPADFVHWIRRTNIGESGGSLNLFGHTETILKTADKKLVLGGNGILGNGILKQGMLADRWILNAIAMIIMCPSMVKELFASTFQEDVGRFNVRIFEGGGWRSIFVDDRIPCSPYGIPLFASSSDRHECWIQILEKAIAKYLYSYGHLANCSPRPDSSLFALRWLTGGHVLKLNVEDFDWNSMDEETVGVNGVAFLEEMLQEGAMVSVGRSETQAIPNSSCAVYSAPLTVIPRPDDCPPYGRLMPIVRVVRDRNGYKQIVLKDPWGLEPRVDLAECQNNASEEIFARTFSVEVEKLVKRYDCMVVCRYPDSLRKYIEPSGFTPWMNVLLNATTCGPKNPARFKLVVSNVDWYNVAKSFGKYKADRHSIRTQTKTEVAEEADNFVDISITLSSAEDWAIVGDQGLAKPQLRLHLRPDEDTLKKIRKLRKSQIYSKIVERDEKLRKIEGNAVSVARTSGSESIDGKVNESQESEKGTNFVLPVVELGTETRSLPPGPPTEKELGAIPRAYIEPKKKGMNGRRSVFHSPIEFLFEQKNSLPTNQMIDDEDFEYKIRSSRSWQSHSFKLLPGTYYILGDVESESSDVVKRGLNLDREVEISERPWNESKNNDKLMQRRKRNGTNRIWMQFSSIRKFSSEVCTEEECPGNFDNDQLIREIREEIHDFRTQIEQKSFELKKCMVEQKDVDAIKDFRALRSKPHIAKVGRLKDKIQKLNQDIKELELKLKEKNRILGELTSAWKDVTEDSWPLMAETQPDVASRELVRIIEDLRTEASGIKSVIATITRQLPRKGLLLRSCC
tara:strand:- start:1670 stop:4528 length:2859 start_codon:yes stop_codon:yes gene_type:complete